MLTNKESFPADDVVERCGLDLILLNGQGYTKKPRLASLLTS